MKLTPTTKIEMTAALHGTMHRPDLTDQDRKRVLEMLQHYVNLVESRAHVQFQNAVEIHEAIDDLVARDQARHATAKDIQCRAGCAHCCKVRVDVSPGEAQLLVQVAKEKGVAIDRALLERQAEYGVKPIDEWKLQPVADRACGFLDPDTQQCRVYEHRPAACRKYFVTSPPADCAVDDKPQSVTQWISVYAEGAATAAMTVMGRVSLPVALLKALDDDQA